MNRLSSLRRLVLGTMLGAAGSFAVSCAAVAEHLSYAPAPVAPLASQPAPAFYVDTPLPSLVADPDTRP
jgi:hypothetical protein